MRIAIISDIHGNRVAVDAALQDMESVGVDGMVCLGDVVERGAQPKQTLDLIRALGCPVVMGNMDDFLIHEPDPGESPGLVHLREWTLSQLDQADLNFIASFQSTCVLPLEDGDDLVCFHGSPDSYLDVILPSTDNEQVARWLTPAEAFMTGGHTHLQQLRHVGESVFFNPGSIGMAYVINSNGERTDKRAPMAEYAILSSVPSTTGIEFRRVRYDPALVARAARSSGRPYADELMAQYSTG